MIDAIDLQPYIIYRCIVGSRAYGLDNSDSDTDYRGIYLPPADMHWSLDGVPQQIERAGSDDLYWEAQRFLKLALKANPTILECLYTPLVEVATPLMQELLVMRERFLSKLVYQTYGGYVGSQFKKLQADLRGTGQVKWKHVMHLLRLLLSGITVLEEGYVPVNAGEHRQRLLAIRRGEMSLIECDLWREELNRRFDAAAAKTQLPDEPDYAAVNAWLLKARRGMV